MQLPIRMGWVLTLFFLLLATGCAGQTPVEEAPTATATAQPDEAAAAAPIALPTVDPADVIPLTTPSETRPQAEMGSAESVPVVIEGNHECAVESDLDLAGYPDLEGVMGCAVEPARFDPVGFNEFGPGPNYASFMLWLSWERQIYVLLPDQTYQVVADTWEEGMATFSCNPTEEEASSPPLPRRGFGKVWCESAEYQERMGFIEREERLCQHAAMQRFESGRMLACFEDAAIRYFRIFDNGTWQAEFQP